MSISKEDKETNEALVHIMDDEEIIKFKTESMKKTYDRYLANQSIGYQTSRDETW